MTTYTVKYHTPDLPRIRGKLEETNIEADSFRTARDGNSVTFFGRVNSESNRLSYGSGSSEQKVGFFNRVCSIVIHRPDEEVKLHDHSLDEPVPSSKVTDQDDEDDEDDED